ncbi:hypothetical protein GCM10011608_11050 [Micromonospora sonchi]|uniref:Uncharacterized protein n=1 Tax=Micromonospora sonchi TaxID=1763543 RepID=A0A917WTJ6_9ACTN|nr:hypothetical protein [Micromonospora sonchi]GGM27993.1 hypothetical protein GCM10011608_11050 [Micromonospora sonchi]
MTPIRKQTREEAVASLAEAWAAASHDRRTRALINAGPITLAKVDATAARVEAGLPAKGMPMPDHTIRDRTDPRIPAWAADVAQRMASFGVEQMAVTFTWTADDVIRHMVADLGSDARTVQLVARVGNVNDMVMFADTSAAGRVLHAHVSWQPHPLLVATIALPATN